MTRSSGILMHISSLPSPYGIGTLGKEAYEFVDFLNKAGQTKWQILPICPTSFGDSPYQSFSTFAGNPYFIDLDILRKQGYLKKKDYENINWGDSSKAVDYGRIYNNRFNVLKKAFKNWHKDHKKDLEAYYNENPWLKEYSLFMALKDFHGGKSWREWKKSYKMAKPDALKEFEDAHKAQINFWGFVQLKFYEQWYDLKSYANKKGIKIIGDIPIYVSRDSADVWANPDQFLLDENLDPINVAGCPPDAFSATGQLWGNPLFRWDKMKKEGYSWWVDRLRAAGEVYDIVRIDHFRAFESYYSIPFGDKTAENGKWIKGPGMDFIGAIQKKLKGIDIIAEDLGYLTEEVYKLMKNSGYPGMKVLEFAFDPREKSNYLPHTYGFKSVVYIGTHDNDTAIGWLNTIGKQDRKYCIDYLRLTKREGYHWGLIKGALSSVSDVAIIQMQDYLGLGSKARMNIPSTVGGNWCWRIKKGAASDKLAKKIYNITKLYSRDVPKKGKNKNKK